VTQVAHRTDFAILTVVPEAWEAVKGLFGKPTRHETDAGQRWPVWEIEVEDGGHAHVVVARLPDRSNIPAYETATMVLETWRPRHLLIADIGGGFHGRDGLDVGDLIAASEIEYYSFAKETAGGNEIRSFSFAAPTLGPRKAFEQLADEGSWISAISSPRTKALPDRPPKVLSGQVVCGELLLANPTSETVRELSARYPKALAVDMESVGVARAVYAAQQASIFTQFGVLRGISDCVDDLDADNQKTRDSAKPYAAAAAVAAAYAYVRNEPSGESVLGKGAAAAPAIAGDGISYFGERLRETLAKAVPAMTSTTFRHTLHSTPARVDQSIAPVEGVEIERGEVLDIAMHDSLVVVVGSSGAGKSVLLDTVARQLAAGSDPLPVRIDLKSGWSPKWAAGLEEAPYGEKLASSMDALLNASSPPLNAEQLGQLAESRQVVMLVDALNEVPPEAATKIRLTLGQYVRGRQVSVLATDRSIVSDYRELRWTALVLPELALGEAREVVDSKFGAGTFDRQPPVRKEILRVPFFLDRAVREDTIDFTSRAEAVEKFLRDGGLDGDDLNVAGEVALDILLRGESVLSSKDERGLTEHGVLEKLKGGGFLKPGPAGTAFSHQLVHQCLAGRRLAGSPDLWTPETLDRLTSSAASLDGVVMTISAIERRPERGRFLRLVYDWNWRAAVVALAETQAGDRPVSEAMEQAILAMIAEKRFDPVKGTGDGVDGLLGRVQCATAERLRATAANELYEYVAGLDHPDVEWWAEWKRAFLRFDPDELRNEATIALLASRMPLIGWMVANSLRRLDSPEAASGLVRLVYLTQGGRSAQARTARWRALHALGAWPSRENAELLVEALGDEHLWCRYGATRSAVEMAARTDDTELRAWIVERLSEEWPKLDPKPLSQLAWASCYRDVDPQWPATIRPLLEAVRSAQEGGERDRWDRRLLRFENYAAEL
jgi:nucleoside phosphorylase